MSNRTVVRNAAYTRSSVGVRERHNERKNEHYSNPDVDLQRTALNIHFKRCETTYTQAFDRLVTDGIISTRGLKAAANIIDELVFDVNSAYFEERGGYEYAKNFYAEAYRLAVEIIGDEQYILSAVMHADERNKSLSEQQGRDIYHYHLHVVYIPVVEKEIKWSKRCKDKSLVGTTKEIIQQVSHSKKWAFQPALDEQGQERHNENGKPVLIPSYSILQDRFFKHMQSAGFTGFERGERGSTAEHLSVLDYKIQQDIKALSEMDERIESRQNHLNAITESLINAQAIQTAIQDVDSLGKERKFSDKMTLTSQEYRQLKDLAKVGIASLRRIGELTSENWQLRTSLQEERQRFDTLYQSTRAYRHALRRAPAKVEAFIREILQPERKRQPDRRHTRDEAR